MTSRSTPLAPHPARPEHVPRSIIACEGVGAAGYIVQRSDTTSRRLVTAYPTLILVEEGRKRIRWSGGERAAGPGDALSVQAGEVVDISNTPGRSGAYRALWICWSPESLVAPPRQHRPPPSPGVVRHAALSESFKSSFLRAFESMSGAETLPASVARSRVQEVLLWLADRGFYFAAPPPASFEHTLRRLVAGDPSVTWSMDRVARAQATSVPTLRRRLASEGVTFRELVHDVRMSHALALLQNTDTPVLQIALASGYASASRFAARFRARFGYLPTDIRGQRRGVTKNRRLR